MPIIFLDCGSNLGQGFEEFRTKYGTDDIVYIMFEPDVKCYNKLCEQYIHLEYVQINNCAVAAQDGELTFYTTRDYDQGGTVIYDHNNNYYDNHNSQSYQVMAVDLIKIIDELLLPHNTIIIKLDVESSEYDILESMIATGTVHKVKKIYCEFHSQYMREPERSQYKAREQNILGYMQQHNINLELWK